MVLMQKPSVIDAPSGGAPEQAPRWDLVDTESCGGGIRFLAPVLIVWGYVCIYRRKKQVGGATRGPRGWGARPGGQGAPPPLWLPGWSPGCFLRPIFFINSKKLLRGFLGHSKNFYFCTKTTPWQFCRNNVSAGCFIQIMQIRGKTIAKVFGKVDTTETYQLPQA